MPVAPSGNGISYCNSHQGKDKSHNQEPVGTPETEKIFLGLRHARLAIHGRFGPFVEVLGKIPRDRFHARKVRKGNQNSDDQENCRVE